MNLPQVALAFLIGMDVGLIYADMEDVSVVAASAEQINSPAVDSEASKHQESSPPNATTTAVVTAPVSTANVSMPFLHIYPLANYTFGVKESALGDWETSYHQRMANLEAHYEKHGMRRTVEAVMITYEHNHPHVLLMQLGDSNVYKL